MKESQSQSSRIVAQMVSVQASLAPSPFEKLFRSPVRLPPTRHIVEVESQAEYYFWRRVFVQPCHNFNI
jgi:hypothetical protein